MAESIIGLFKTEVIQRKGPWRHLDAVEFATLGWVDWFNRRRLLEPIRYVRPSEYEAQYDAQLDADAAIIQIHGVALVGIPLPTTALRAGRRAPARRCSTRGHLHY
jgi:hypothetical protein